MVNVRVYSTGIFNVRSYPVINVSDPSGKIGRRGRTYKLINDGRHEQRKGIQRSTTPHVDDGRSVRLPILHTSPEVVHLELLVLRARLLIRRQPPQDTPLIRLREELRVVRKVMNHPERRNADNDGGQTLEDEDPAPPVLPTDTVHLGDRGGEETTEGACQRGRGEEDGHTDAELGTPVPARQVVSDTGEEAGFTETQEPSCCHQAGVVVDEAHEGHADALAASIRSACTLLTARILKVDTYPEHHNNRNKDTRPQFLQEYVGQRLEDGV